MYIEFQSTKIVIILGPSLAATYGLWIHSLLFVFLLYHDKLAFELATQNQGYCYYCCKWHH